jgi:glucose/arabinose dehydrogenase
LIQAALLVALAAMPAQAQVNAGEQKSDPDVPFNMTTVTTFTLPWRMAFLPDGRMLITEKVGPLWLVTQQGQKTLVANTPPVYWQGAERHAGRLPVADVRDRPAHLSHLRRARGLRRRSGPGSRHTEHDGTAASLRNVEVLWRQLPKGKGGQEGAAVAFSPDGQYLFLTVGDRQRFTPAQDPDQPVGKILRLTLDGKPRSGNPNYGKTGASTIPLIDPPSDTETAKTAKVVSNYTFTGPNNTPAETWTMGHRTPYGLAFSPTGELWEIEHGPRGGDELNLIEKGKNYGWPLVGYAPNYNGVAIPHPDTSRTSRSPRSIGCR